MCDGCVTLGPGFCWRNQGNATGKLGDTLVHLAGPGVGGAEPDTARPTATAPPRSVRTNLGGLAYDALPKTSRRTSYASRVSSGRRRPFTRPNVFPASRSFPAPPH